MAMRSRSHEITCENPWDPWKIKSLPQKRKAVWCSVAMAKMPVPKWMLKLSFRSSFHSFSFFFGKDFLSHTDEVRGYLDRFITLDVFHAFFKRE